MEQQVQQMIATKNANGGGNDDADSVEEQLGLDCPVCLEPYARGKSILQCKNGHLICSGCHAKLTYKDCPVCRIKYEARPIRNLFAEKMVEMLPQSCRFKNRGCREVCPTQEGYDRHVKVCYHRTVPCPGNLFCAGVIPFSSVMEHTLAAHSKQFFAINDINGLLSYEVSSPPDSRTCSG